MIETPYSAVISAMVERQGLWDPCASLRKKVTNLRIPVVGNDVDTMEKIVSEGDGTGSENTTLLDQVCSYLRWDYAVNP